MLIVTEKLVEKISSNLVSPIYVYIISCFHFAYLDYQRIKISACLGLGGIEENTATYSVRHNVALV